MNANVRDNYNNRKLVADSLVSAMQQFLSIYQQNNLQSCSLTAKANLKNLSCFIISPNHAKDSIRITYTNYITDFEIELIDFVGQTICEITNQNKLNAHHF